MDTEAVENLARHWIGEYGRHSVWHLRRKIAHLQEWGDDEGVRLYRQVLGACEMHASIAARPIHLAQRPSRFSGIFRRRSARR